MAVKTFAPHYLEVDDTEGDQLRIHYLDEGPADGDVVLLMHHQPVWSYLYRHMIPQLVDAGFRVLDFHVFGWGPIVVTRYLDGEQLIWETVDGSTTRMDRICKLPEEHKMPTPGAGGLDSLPIAHRRSS
jgi:hypothetical protein